MTLSTKQSPSEHRADKASARQLSGPGKSASFRNAVADVASRYGVIVGSTRVKTADLPKPISASRALEIARSAGIITKAGKLSTRYK